MLHSGKSMEFWPSWISSCYPPVQFLAGAQARCSVNSVLGCLQGRSPLGRAWQKAQGGFCCFCPFLCSSPTCLPLALHPTLLLLLPAPASSFTFPGFSLPACWEVGAAFPNCLSFIFPFNHVLKEHRGGDGGNVGLCLFIETPAQTDGNYQSKSRVTGLELRQFASALDAYPQGSVLCWRGNEGRKNSGCASLCIA